MPMFMVKTWQSLAFGVLPVYTACVRMFILRQVGAHRSIKTLMCVTYMWKPMTLADIDKGNHTVTAMHTM